MRICPRAATVAICAAGVLLAGCGGRPATDVPAPADDPLTARLADAFRIDLAEVDVTYDYRPGSGRVEGSATLAFRMRPGQSRPLFHFNPIRGGDGPAPGEMLTSLELDGEQLDPGDPEDLRRLRPLPSAEPAFEVQREVAGDGDHELRVGWAMPYRETHSYPGWFLMKFDDTIGPPEETETIWPTVSSPEEQARHRVRLRIHSDRPYTAIGSGGARRIESPGAQEWEIDSGQPIASHTMFFATMPTASVSRTTFDVDGVAVRIVSDRSPGKVRRARAETERTIRALVERLGPFPMPRMDILLTGWSSGMEYYGATRTGLGALEHELAHMYFGASAVNRTWRDTWIDEAVASVLERLGERRAKRLPDGYRSERARGGGAVAPGWDNDGYSRGAQMLAEVGDALGGERELLAFLADLHERRAFRPFTTRDLIADVVAAQDEIERKQLERWVYGR